MASYLPHHQAPRLWQSDAPEAGPVRRAGVSRVSSGSGRSYAGTAKPGVSFARSGAALQQVTGQYGNYLLYRDQVRHANAMMEAHLAKEEGAALNQAAGTAIEGMLGGVARNSRKSGNPQSRLGSPRTGGTPPSSSPSTPSVGAVGPSPKLPSQSMQGEDTFGGAPAWQKADTMGGLSPFLASRKPMDREIQGQPVTPLPNSQRGFKRPGLASPVLEPGASGIVGEPNEQLTLFGRQGFQPQVAPGNTGPRTETQRVDARVARQRKAGGNFGNIRYNT